jgi:hypothetical protein
MVLMKQISIKDRLERKKYIGAWRWTSELMTRMMRKLPSTVTKYIYRNSPKNSTCSSGSSERTRMRNSDTLVWFPTSI